MPSSAEITNVSLGDVAVNTNLRVTSYVDDSANAGDRTVNALRGKSAFNASASVTITNNKVTANSQIIVTLEGAADAQLTAILRATPTAGGFTVVGNMDPAAPTKFSWIVIN